MTEENKVNDQKAGDVKLAGQPKKIQIDKIKVLKNPVLSFKGRLGTTVFEQPEYDLAEIGRIEDVESYVRRAFRYKDGLMFKEGWQLTGKNNQTIKYIKRRFQQMDAATGIAHELLFRGIGSDLVRFSNSFLVRVRNEKASGGKVRTLPNGKRVEPTAGYFAVPPTTIEIMRDDSGKVLRYRQRLPYGEYKEFPADSVLHFYIDRKKGFMIGTPILIPVKDDIRALRRIEENIELLLYQHLFPLYHYRVGTEDQPAREYSDGYNEIDIVKAEIELMPSEGAIVTPERHEIKAIGAQGRAIQAEGYLKHFKQRVFAGLGTSGVDFGDGETTNRSTAETMSRNMIDDVKSIQREFEIFINEYIIKELLLESTFSDPLDDKNIVKLVFNEIDLDAQIKIENHANNLFTGYGITHTEYRNMLGREPLTKKEEEDIYWTKYEQPKLLIQAVDEPWSEAAKAVAKSENTIIEEPDRKEAEAKELSLAKTKQAPASKDKPGPAKTKKTSGQRASTAADKPSNQHGEKLSPEKRKSSITFSDMVGKNNRITSIYDDLLNDTLLLIKNGGFSVHWLSALSIATKNLMKNKFLSTLRVLFRKGYRDVTVDFNYNLVENAFRELENRVDNIIHRMFMKLVQRVKTEVNDHDSSVEIKEKIINIFDGLRFRSRFIYNSEIRRAYNYGVFVGLKSIGKTQARIIAADDACEECQSKEGAISLEHASIDDVPYFHPNCNCRLVSE